MYKIYYIYMYKIYMCVSYDLKVSNEDFCCWGKNSSDIFKQWKSFPCSRLAYPDINTSAGDGRIGGSYDSPRSLEGAD